MELISGDYLNPDKAAQAPASDPSFCFNTSLTLTLEIVCTLKNKLYLLETESCWFISVEYDQEEPSV